MKPDQIEQQIYLALINKRTKFTVDGVDFEKEKVITGTQKERQRQCRARARELTKIITE